MYVEEVWNVRERLKKHDIFSIRKYLLTKFRTELSYKVMLFKYKYDPMRFLQNDLLYINPIYKGFAKILMYSIDNTDKVVINTLYNLNFEKNKNDKVA
jgi:hypothetical protein